MRKSTCNPRGAIIYNAGRILTGLALFPFFAGFYYWYTDERWRKSLIVVTQAVGFIAAFSLMMIGVFSEDAGAIHHLWSLVFFVFNLFVLILANVSLITHRQFIRPVGYYWPRCGRNQPALCRFDVHIVTRVVYSFYGTRLCRASLL